jgi:TRAP transporter TAXI family solute receptor
MNIRSFLYGILISIFTVYSANSETRITYKSAKSTSSYYQMGVQIAQTIKKSSNGQMIVTIEESQGSVQNVKEVIGRKGNYVFTTPPVLVKLAIDEKAMFKGKGNPRYKEIRALFPIPSLTMHFVMSKKSGVTSFEEMSGKTILLGKGSFGAKEGAKYLKIFGLEGKVKLAEVELSNAVPALKNGQIDGFVTAGSYPAPNVVEASATMDVNVVSLSDEQIKISKRTKLIIPAGTYSGQNKDINTTSLPVVAYSITDMNDDVAYSLTKSYWENKGKLGEAAKWWNGVSYDMLSNVSTKIHPGAIKFYKEVGAKLAKHHM